MAAYVEKERLIGFLKSLPQGVNSDISIRTVIDIVAKFIPMIVLDYEKLKSGEYKPVIHAHWICHPCLSECSNCNWLSEATYKFCPLCGAKMDEVIDD